MPVATTPERAPTSTEPSHRRGRRFRRLDASLLAVATATGLWLGMTAPGTTPVAAPATQVAAAEVAAPTTQTPANQDPQGGPGPDLGPGFGFGGPRGGGGGR